jgi:hypothetical protein
MSTDGASGPTDSPKPHKINIFREFPLAVRAILRYNFIINGGGALAADYGKNLFKHNQAPIAENEKLQAKTAKGQIRREVVSHGEPKGNYASKYMIDLGFEAAATLAGQGLAPPNEIAGMTASMSKGAF